MRTTREKLPEHQEFLLFRHNRAAIEYAIGMPVRQPFDQFLDGLRKLERILVPMLDKIMLVHVLDELVKWLIESINIEAETRARSQMQTDARHDL